ncbi:uncharacterized protein FIBRA_08217 [Fibroporia radiculosa]|uniref:C2H2-type domain-containing protein n=1 Tax=Fibroporia radiculosa TaxID=599839 RepID=J4IC86_9APHY|nr:uncharacterized protein FIBRA_08217 [Fibroporia radiculosa]CCM05976.1 predicted protein [Fibroporia radiculosa]
MPGQRKYLVSPTAVPPAGRATSPTSSRQGNDNPFGFSQRIPLVFPSVGAQPSMESSLAYTTHPQESGISAIQHINPRMAINGNGSRFPASTRGYGDVSYTSNNHRTDTYPYGGNEEIKGPPPVGFMPDTQAYIDHRQAASYISAIDVSPPRVGAVTEPHLDGSLPQDSRMSTCLLPRAPLRGRSGPPHATAVINTTQQRGGHTADVSRSRPSMTRPVPGGAPFSPDVNTRHEYPSVPPMSRQIVDSYHAPPPTPPTTSLSTISACSYPHPKCEWADCDVGLDDISTGGMRRHFSASHPDEAVSQFRGQEGKCRWTQSNGSECGKVLLRASLAKHCATVHLRSMVKNCLVCHEPFSRPDAVARHLDTVHRRNGEMP